MKDGRSRAPVLLFHIDQAEHPDLMKVKDYLVSLRNVIGYPPVDRSAGRH